MTDEKDARIAALEAQLQAAQQLPAPEATSSESGGSAVAQVLGLLLAVGVVVIIAVGVSRNKKEPMTETDRLIAELNAQTNRIVAQKVTRSEYDRISDGMTRSAVESLIGAPGTEISRSSVGGFTTFMLSWRNSDGSNMNAMFQGEFGEPKLVSKAQFGL